MSALQEFGLQYTITGTLGGTRRSPPFSLDESNPLYVAPDEEGLRNFVVEDMGVVDLPLAPGTTSVGVRFVKQLWVSAPPQAPGSQGVIEVVDSQTLQVFQRFVSLPAGVMETVYRRARDEVPQGASLRFSGWNATADSPVRLRLGVRPAVSVRQWARWKQVLCCTRPEVDGGEDPGQQCPQPTGFTPPTVSTGITPVPFTITGTNFDVCTIIVIIAPTGGGPPLPVSLSTVSPTVITGTFTPIGAGTYDVIVACAEDPQGCNGQIDSALTIID